MYRGTSTMLSTQTTEISHSPSFFEWTLSLSTRKNTDFFHWNGSFQIKFSQYEFKVWHCQHTKETLPSSLTSHTETTFCLKTLMWLQYAFEKKHTCMSSNQSEMVRLTRTEFSLCPACQKCWLYIPFQLGTIKLFEISNIFLRHGFLLSWGNKLFWETGSKRLNFQGCFILSRPCMKVSGVVPSSSGEKKHGESPRS